MWYNIRLKGPKGHLTLRTFAQDAAQAVENAVCLFPMSQGFRVINCFT
jgi:hypothetical protein